MGFFDFLGDVCSSLSITEVHAEAPDQSDGSAGSAQQSGKAGVKGGASNDTPAAKHEEGGEEGEANKEDAKKAKERTSGGDEGQDGGEDGGDDDAGSDGGDDAGEEEEEEEEEEEPEDAKPKLEEECMNSKQCASYKHHYDECAERVQKQTEDGGKAEEDCVEEFFHLMHCASACAAPKLWAQLK